VVKISRLFFVRVQFLNSFVASKFTDRINLKPRKISLKNFSKLRHTTPEVIIAGIPFLVSQYARGICWCVADAGMKYKMS
jgi:hypothetical protein